MSVAVRILAEDPDLADGLTGRRLEAAVADCVAETCECPTGVWSPPEQIGDTCFGLGLLILDGLVVRSVGVGGRYGAELLGDGDLLTPTTTRTREPRSR